MSPSRKPGTTSNKRKKSELESSAGDRQFDENYDEVEFLDLHSKIKEESFAFGDANGDHDQESNEDDEPSGSRLSSGAMGPKVSQSEDGCWIASYVNGMKVRIENESVKITRNGNEKIIVNQHATSILSGNCRVDVSDKTLRVKSQNFESTLTFFNRELSTTTSKVDLFWNVIEKDTGLVNPFFKKLLSQCYFSSFAAFSGTLEQDLVELSSDVQNHITNINQNSSTFRELVALHPGFTSGYKLTSAFRNAVKNIWRVAIEKTKKEFYPKAKKPKRDHD